MKKNIACIIPARSGSKRIKNKNLVKIKNIPLIKYVCKRILKSRKIQKFYIATDNIKIYNSIGNLKKKINFFKRSKKSSSSKAKSEEVLKEFLLLNKDFEIVVFLQATNPFVDYKHLDAAIGKFTKSNFDSLLSVVNSKSFLWKKSKIKPINYNYKNRKMSQNLEGYYIENGSFYIFYRKKFLKFINRLHGKIGTYVMPKESAIEIDDLEDLNLVRKILK